MACAICEIRRPRRFCPGVRGEICTLCCGTEREVSVRCPLNCPYLVEARLREKKARIRPEDVPDHDIQVSDKFIDDHEDLLEFVSHHLLAAALETPGVVDADVSEALAALVRTYRTLESGVLYQSRPTNPLADALYARVQNAASEFRRRETEKYGVNRTRDADVLGALVVLRRLALQHQNGRKLSRGFIDYVRGFLVPISAPAPEASPLIVP